MLHMLIVTLMLGVTDPGAQGFQDSTEVYEMNEECAVQDARGLLTKQCEQWFAENEE